MKTEKEKALETLEKMSETGSCKVCGEDKVLHSGECSECAIGFTAKEVNLN